MLPHDGAVQVLAGHDVHVSSEVRVAVQLTVTHELEVEFHALSGQASQSSSVVRAAVQSTDLHVPEAHRFPLVAAVHELHWLCVVKVVPAAGQA